MTAPDLEHRLKRALSATGGASSDFDLNPDVALPPSRKLTGAAVLVGVMRETSEVLLTKRSARLKHHPGQIAFPGGKIDPTDDGPVDAALREAEEEVGLDRKTVSVLGQLPSHETVTGYTVHPVLALIDRDFTPRAEVGEVSEVFRVPLSHVTDPAQFLVQSRRWQGRQRHYYVVPYGPFYIWGATARILRALAEKPLDPTCRPG